MTHWIAERAWDGELGPSNDTAIGLQLVGFAVTMLPLAALNFREFARVA